MNKKLLTKIVTALFTITSIAFTPTSNVEAKINKSRIYGKSRIETSVEISKEGWKSGSNAAVIAQGYNYADALSSAPLAKKYNAPILLTEGSKLSDSTINELKRLKVKEVLLVGGPKVVSENVEKQLKSININNISRLYGATRYETSLKIAEKLGKSSEVFITSGNGYADSLSVASIAAKKGTPILFVEKDFIKDSVKQYIKNNGVNKVYAIGGSASISDKALNGLNNVERLYGNDRFETNKKVLERFKSDINFENVYVVQGAGPKGNEFADALSCSALAARKGSPIVLTYKDITPGLEKFVTNNLTLTSTITAIGGETVVPSSILDKLQSTNIQITEINKKDTVYGDEKNTKTIDGDLLVNADNVTLQNLDVKGVLSVNPGENGSTNIKNVTANTILIKSGAKDSIHLSKVKAQNLIVDSKSEVRVEIKDNTFINNTEVKTSSILENASSDFGNVTISDSLISNAEKSIQFKGNFSEIKIIKEGKIKILKDSKVEKIIAGVKCNIDIESGAVVNKVEKGNNDVKISGTVNSNRSSGGGGGSSSSSSYRFKLIVSKNNGSTELLNKSLKIENSKNVIDYLKSVAKVTEEKESGAINGIDGLANKTIREITEEQRKRGIMGESWAAYLNGKKILTGTLELSLKSGDVLKFDYHEWDWKDLVESDYKGNMPIKLESPDSVKINKEFDVKATCVDNPVYEAVVKVDGKEVGKTDVDGCFKLKIDSTGKHVITVEKQGGIDEKTIEIKSSGESDDENNEEDFNVDITENNKVYGEENKTKNIGGNVNIKANNVTLQNVNIKGILTIDAGIDGTANIKNVTAAVIEVKSGDINSIHLINTKSQELIVNSRSHVRVQLNDDSKMVTTRVKTTSILDEVKGTFGNIIIENSTNGNTEKREVELRGNFDKPITVKGQAKLTCSGNVEKISVEPETKSEIDIKGNVKSLEILKEAKVNLSGDISKVKVFKQAEINVDKNSKVNTITTVAKTEINVEEGADVSKVQIGTENSDDVKINGKVNEIEKIKGDDVKQDEDPNENPEDEDSLTLIISKNNGSLELKREVLKIKKDNNAMQYLKSVAKVTENQGPGFINGIDELLNKDITEISEEQRKRGIMGEDWFIYINGKKTDKGALGVYPQAGDILKFDYHEWDWHENAPGEKVMPIKLGLNSSVVKNGVNVNESFDVRATCQFQPVYEAVVKVDGVEVGKTDMNGYATIKITLPGEHKISVEKENGVDEKTIIVKENSTPGEDTDPDTKPEKPSDDKFKVSKNGDKVQITIENKENIEVAITVYDLNDSLVYIGQSASNNGVVKFNTVLDDGKYYAFYKFKNGEKIRVEFQIK